jgi:hypothetical protein
MPGVRLPSADFRLPGIWFNNIVACRLKVSIAERAETSDAKQRLAKHMVSPV